MSHDLAHVTHALGTGGRDNLIDHSGQFVCGQLLRKIGLENLDLGTLDCREILAVTFLELLNRVAALLEQLVENGNYRSDVEHDSFFDYDLLHGSEN